MSDLNKQASSADRHPAVVQGQEDLTGVKSVEIKRALKKNSDSEYVVNESIRTEMLYDTVSQAKDAYNNIQDAKEEAVFADKEDTGDKQTTESTDETATASYAFGMSVLANNITGFSGVSIEEAKQPINWDEQVSEDQLNSFTRFNGTSTIDNPPPGANSMVCRDPVTAEAEASSLIEPNFPVSDLEHELTLGVNRELEHVSDPAKALEIAIDHLAEDKQYYTKLNTIMPEYGPEEKPERVVTIDEEKTPHELAEQHDYNATYNSFVKDMLGNDK